MLTKNKIGGDPLLTIVYRHIRLIFQDQNNQFHVAVQQGTDQTTTIYDLPSKNFERWVRRVLLQINQATYSPADVERVVAYIEAMAEDPAIEVRPYFSRVAQIDKTLYYNLGNNKVVKLSANDLSVIDNADLEVYFSQVVPQVEPDFSAPPPSLPMLLQPFFRMKKADDYILLISFLVTAFVCDINHPLLILYGAAGSSKSTTASNIGQIIDPQRGSNRLTMNPDRRGMIAALSNRYFLNFDNLPCTLRKWQSDLFCSVCTGGAEPMRRLYETNSFYSAPIKGVVSINGVTLAATEPDLLDRAILLELDRIDEQSFISDEELNKRFQAALPAIMGAIFNCLHHALKLEVIITSYPKARMQDFAKFAYLVWEAIGTGMGEQFAERYKANRELARSEARPPLMVDCMVSFMQHRECWTGTMTQLRESLWTVAKRKNYRQIEYPQSASAFSRQLHDVQTALKLLGITFTQQVGGNRKLEIINNQYEPSDFI